MHAPFSVSTEQGTYLYYDGTGGSDPYAGWSIGLAIETPAGWTRVAEPVLGAGPPGAWDGASVHDPRVLREGGSFLMWYSGFDGSRWRIGLAESSEGIHWIKHPQNPVLETGGPGTWDETGVAYSSVRRDGSSYRMWYQGRDREGRWRIGHATSTEGVVWVKDPGNPVLAPGPTGAWDSERVFTPDVTRGRAGWIMLYAGSPRWGLGVARSEDGRRWRKDPGNPFLPAGREEQVMTPAFSNGLLWYAVGTPQRLGLAVRPLRFR